MLITNHPDDERLSALASRDEDATLDDALTSHVTDCARCAEVVSELGALCAALAALPDLVPPHPLRLVPAVADAPVASGGIGAWARRLFAPALTAGAALAMVGLVGTAGPLFQGAASGPVPEAAMEPAASAADVLATGGGSSGETDTHEPAVAPGGSEASESPGSGGVYARSSADPSEGRTFGGSSGGGQEEGTEPAQLPAERSPWPMVLFTGVALMVAAALLRWILVPRAG